MKKRLEDFTLKELRELYPEIKSNSKSKFISQIEDETKEVLSNNDDEEYSDIPEEEFEVLPELPEGISKGVSLNKALTELIAESDNRTKILVVFEERETGLKAIKEIHETFKEYADVDNATLMFSDSSMELHFDGKFFIKFSCAFRWKSVSKMYKFKKIIFVDTDSVWQNG